MANTNPIILDAAGRCVIYLDPAVTYKYVMAPPNDTDPPASPIWTIDPVNPVPEGETANVDIEGVAGENVSAGDILYVSQGDGGRTDGRWYLGDATNDYSSSTAAAIGFAQQTVLTGATLSIRIAGTQTDSGLNPGDVYYIDTSPGGLTNVVPGNPKIVGVAQSATSLVIGVSINQYATQTVPGIVSTGTQTFGGDKTFADDLALGGTATGDWDFEFAPRYFPGTSTSTSQRVSGRMDSKISSTNSSNSVDVDLYSFTIPANTFDTDGAVVRMVAWGLFAGNGNTKVLNFQAANMIAKQQLVSTTANGTFWRATIELVRTGASSLRLCATALSATATAQGVETIASALGSTFSGTTALKIISTTSTAAADIVCEGGYVESIGV